MRILAAHPSSEAIRAILECLGLPSRAPPIARDAETPETLDLQSDEYLLTAPPPPAAKACKIFEPAKEVWSKIGQSDAAERGERARSTYRKPDLPDPKAKEEKGSCSD